MAIGNILNQKAGLQTINNQEPDPNGNYNVTPSGIGALPISGGEMTGPLAVQTPSANNQAVNLGKAKDLVNGAWKTATGELSSTGWDSSHEQKILCPGIKPDSRVIASADGSSQESAIAWSESQVWAKEISGDNVIFRWYEEEPKVTINVIIFYEVGA